MEQEWVSSMRVVRILELLLPSAYPSAAPGGLFASFRSLHSARITPKRSDWMQSPRKIFRLQKKLFSTFAVRHAPQARSRYRLFESEFDRESNFETPIAIFFLHVE